MDGKRLQFILGTAVVLLIALLISAFLVLRRQGQTPAMVLSNDFWIFSRNNPGGDGSLANPFDGSTRTKFDRVMNSLPPNSTIHLLGGTYQTCGFSTNAWTIKTGQKIIGSGIDNTIIHLNYIGGGNQIGNAPTGGTNIEVSDLTIDGLGTSNYTGLFIWGDHSAIRRVKARNFSNSTREIFLLAIVSYCDWCNPPRTFSGEGNVIEESEVNITNSGPFTAIEMGGGPTRYGSGTIRNNRVIVNPLSTYNNRFGLNIGHSHDLLVEGNYVYGADVGFYSEVPNRNLTVVNNSFENVLLGAHTLFSAQTNLTCSFNNISLAPIAAPAWNAGFDFEGPTSGEHRNILMSQNTIQFYNAPGSGMSYSSHLHKCSGVRFVNNRVDARLWPASVDSRGVQIFGNSDLEGGPWVWDREPAHSMVRTLVTGTDYQIVTADRYIGIRNGGVTSTTVRLPNPRGWPGDLSGKEFVIAREDGGASFILAAVTGITINGANSLVITKGSSNLAATVSVISDGTNWFAR